MLPERPRLPPAPCAVCAEPLDPLRAPRVLWLGDRARFLCSSTCQSRFLDGEHAYDTAMCSNAEQAGVERPSIPDLVREATLVREVERDHGGDRTHRSRVDSLAAAGLALFSLALVGLSASRELGWLAAFLLALCAAVNVRLPLGTIEAGIVARVIAPLGLALAALTAVLTDDPQTQRWSLIGVGVAALAISSRGWVHATMAAPVRSLAGELVDTLPSAARIPSADANAYEEIRTAQLRPGDLAVVLEGERVPQDGVVEEGSAIGLRYPKAAHSKPYAPGDFVLAGTRMIEGAITLRVVRTRHERGIVRAVELRRRQRHDQTMGWRLRVAISAWSGVLIAPAALALLSWQGPGPASALLLGLPVLALVAALDAPLEAGALASARRGMFFGSSTALRQAGRTGTAAILLRGALTAGEPIVQRVQALGPTDVDRVVALAAAAERAANDHPIARAIRRHADEQMLSRAAVRKERVLPGLGVTAVASNGARVVVGRRQLLLNEGISVAIADEDATRIEAEGLTPILVAVGGTLEALIAILDPIHVGAPDAVRRITDLPCEVVILSGDDRRTVERIAANLGASRVKAPLLPAERVAEVEALRETGGVTAAIGRGGEDDSVLAAADVPVSLRLVGTALEDRGAVIASRDVRDAAGALWIARAVARSTWKTLSVGIVLSAAVAVSAGLGWLTPMAAALVAVAMEAWALRAGSRLLRRVDLRVPMRQ